MTRVEQSRATDRHRATEPRCVTAHVELGSAVRVRGAACALEPADTVHLHACGGVI